MSKDGVWKLTSLGRKRAGSIYSKEAKDSVLAYLYENKTASVEELALHAGIPASVVSSKLRKLEKANMVESLGG